MVGGAVVDGTVVGGAGVSVVGGTGVVVVVLVVDVVSGVAVVDVVDDVAVGGDVVVVVVMHVTRLSSSRPSSSTQTSAYVAPSGTGTDSSCHHSSRSVR